VIGLWAGRTARSALALPWFILGCVGTVIVGAALAYDAPRTYFRTAASSRNTRGRIRRSLSLARSPSSGWRFWSMYWRNCTPSAGCGRCGCGRRFSFGFCRRCLVVPLEFMSREPLGRLMQLNETPLYASELFAPLACLLVAAMSVWHQRAWFLSYAILHLAWSLYHLTSVHFLQELRWPLALVMVGAGLLVLGVWRECRRTFQAEPSPPAGTPGVSAYGDEVTSTQRTRPIGGGGSINEIS
jgi:hypothetical protein